MEEIENYNQKFAKHIDQKISSIWSVGGSGALAITDEKSGQEALVDHNSLFNEENEEVRLRMNYLEFLENQVFYLKKCVFSRVFYQISFKFPSNFL